MVRSVLIVAFAATIGSLLGLSTWFAFVFVVYEQGPIFDTFARSLETLRITGLIFAVTLVFTAPGAALLLGVEMILRERKYSAQVQTAILLIVGLVAGGAILGITPSILSNEPTSAVGVYVGAWFGLCTAIAFAALSSRVELRRLRSG